MILEERREQIMVIIFYLFLSCSSKNSPSVLLARVPFVRSHCGRLFSPSSRSFHFSTLPFLRCVPFSPQIAHWPALLFTLPVRHGLSPQQPATTPPQPQPHSSLQLQEDNYFFISPPPAHCPTVCCCHIVVRATL